MIVKPHPQNIFLIILLFLVTFGFPILIYSILKTPIIPLLLFLLCGVFLIANCGAVGRTIALHKEGITVSFLCFKKTYKWSELKTKRYVDNRAFYPYPHGSFYYAKGVEFSYKKIKRAPRKESYNYCLYHHPFSLIFIYFETDKLPQPQHRTLLVNTVKQEEFAEKMAEWGVVLQKT